MKKISYLIGLSFFVFLSCQKVNQVVCDVNDDISGRYVLTMAHWLGQPIDIDNDGLAHSDILQEFSSSINMLTLKTSLGAMVYNVSELNPTATISISLPMQSLFKHADDINFSGDLYKAWVNFDYSIKDDGSIVISQPDYSEFDYDQFQNPHLCEVSGAKIMSIENGVICAQVIVPYIDFKTNKLYVNPLFVRYQRVSSKT